MNPRANHGRQRRHLVTGASSGIGLELARCFAEDRHRLIVTADDAPELEDAAASLRGSGEILITSSIAGLVPVPKLNVYSATMTYLQNI